MRVQIRGAPNRVQNAAYGLALRLLRHGLVPLWSTFKQSRLSSAREPVALGPWLIEACPRDQNLPALTSQGAGA